MGKTETYNPYLEIFLMFVVKTVNFFYYVTSKDGDQTFNVDAFINIKIM